MVGREPEMARLAEALDEAANGRGGLALIGGEPGMGKTRLAEELVAHAHLRGARVLWGRCDQSDKVPAYWPWIQALRGFGHDRDTGEDRDSEFSRMIAAEGERGTLADPRPEKGRFRLFDALTTFLRRAARERPTLLVLDDLHEADVTSLQLLRHVAREAGEMPLLLVGTYRDVDLAPDHPLTAMMGELVREHLKTRISLSGLNAEQVGRFVHATAGVTPAAAVIAVLHRETEGNPFFVKQCALMLDDEAARRSLRSGQMTVPPNVRDAIVRRLATLSPDCREMLEVASVAGHVFDVPLLRANTQTRPARLLDVLHEATSARIVHSDDASRDSYSFWHGLIRQTLYDGMGAERRTSLHRRIAESLESRGGADQRVAELAHHCFEAALGDGDAEKAIGYALRAGEEALAVYAWDQALRHWEMAHHLMEQYGSSSEALADILERLPVLISNVGEDFQTGIDYLEQAIALREQLGHSERAAEDHSKLGIALSMHVGDARHARTTNLTRALEHYRAAEPVLGGGPDRPSVAMFHAGLATVAFSGLQIQDGLASTARAMEVAERLNMTGVWATATLLRGGVLKLGGRLAESTELLERAYRLADEVNDHQVAFYTSTNLADWTEGFDAGRGDLLLTELSRPRNATPSVQRTTLINDIGCGLTRNGRLAEARAQLDSAPAAFLRTMLEFCDGEWDAVGAGLHDGIDILRQVGNKSSLANRLNHLAALYLARDDLARAEQMLNEELVLAIEGGSPLVELRARAELALAGALTGRPEAASTHLARCREILANGEEWGRKAGRVALAEGVMAYVAGDAAQAERHINYAIDVFRGRALPWEEADARVRHARLLDRAGQATLANDQREQAVRIYRAIGAGSPWIARAKAP
jgi:tetratricopeptide (TPR) repeat protein